jgi:hypothetical protein
VSLTAELPRPRPAALQARRHVLAAVDVVLAGRVARVWRHHRRCCTSRVSNGSGAETGGVWRVR